jgi:quercetin dioxygenase-like cupin family protein
VRSWDLLAIETPDGSRSPVVLHSEPEARAVLIGLQPGQRLGEHQVKEHAFVLVLEGSVRVSAGEESFEAQAGTLVRFDADERRTLAAESGARLLLVLAPWPGPGHYRGEEKAAAVTG